MTDRRSDQDAELETRYTAPPLVDEDEEAT
jgi:hypothetical protein